MSSFGFIPPASLPSIRFDVAPLANVVCSICLLNQDHLDHISPWVERTLASITPEEKRRARFGCGAGLFLAGSRAQSVEAFVAELRARDPDELVTMELERLVSKASEMIPGDQVPPIERLRADQDAYLRLVERLMAEEERAFDRAEAEEEYGRLANPQTYRDQMADAIEFFWTHHLRDEWERVRPTIEDSVAAFRSAVIRGSTIEERLRFITGRDFIPTEWLEVLNAVKEIVYVPSVHIGPYMLLFDVNETRAMIVGRARVPEGATIHPPRLDRSDLLMRLEALSDATRLAILSLTADRGALTTQQAMDELDLSQSSASRHLTQLAATGLLSVDASERTKRYHVNTARLDEVCSGIRALVAPREGT